MTKRYPLLLLALLIALTFISYLTPHDRFTWWLEVTPAIIVTAILMVTHRRFPLSSLLYTLVALHCMLLIVGGHYTYAEEPLFNWLRDHYHLQRNYYDRLGHFMQGFVPAIAARELLLRTSPLKWGKWMIAIIILGCLGVSASYELIEWMTAELTGDAADSFLGTQGDVWDTQKDMLLAFIGASISLLTLSRLHDKSLARIQTV